MTGQLPRASLAAFGMWPSQQWSLRGGGRQSNTEPVALNSHKYCTFTICIEVSICSSQPRDDTLGLRQNHNIDSEPDPCTETASEGHFIFSNLANVRFCSTRLTDKHRANVQQSHHHIFFSPPRSSRTADKGAHSIARLGNHHKSRACGQSHWSRRNADYHASMVRLRSPRTCTACHKL